VRGVRIDGVHASVYIREHSVVHVEAGAGDTVPSFEAVSSTTHFLYSFSPSVADHTRTIATYVARSACWSGFWGID